MSFLRNSIFSQSYPQLVKGLMGTFKVSGLNHWGVFGEIENNVLWKRANFVFSVKRQVRDKGVTETRNVRISSVKRAWGNLLKKADVEPIQLRDLRTFFNWMLVSQYGLSHKEAGAYLGNSEAVNYNHYTPVSLETIGAKLRGLGDKKIISQLVA